MRAVSHRARWRSRETRSARASQGVAPSSAKVARVRATAPASAGSPGRRVLGALECDRCVLEPHPALARQPVRLLESIDRDRVLPGAGRQVGLEPGRLR